jgi:hypothetical protein
MLTRALIVLGCYLLSSLGIITSAFLAMNSFIMTMVDLLHFKATHIALSFVAFGLPTLHAWLALGVMSIAWIRHRKVNRRWLVTGTLAGVISLTCLPIIATFQDIHRGFVMKNGVYSTDIYDILLLFGKTIYLPLIFVFPCVLLAIYLVLFHWINDYPEAGSSV